MGATVAGPVAAAGSGADLEKMSVLVAGETLPVGIVPGDSTLPSHCPADMAGMPSGAGVVDPVALVAMEAALAVEAAFVDAQHENHFVLD